MAGSARLARWGSASAGLAAATKSSISSVVFIRPSFLVGTCNRASCRSAGAARQRPDSSGLRVAWHRPCRDLSGLGRARKRGELISRVHRLIAMLDHPLLIVRKGGEALLQILVLALFIGRGRRGGESVVLRRLVSILLGRKHETLSSVRGCSGAAVALSMPIV